jgi:COP9 signalosome complex subunit 5
MASSSAADASAAQKRWQLENNVEEVEKGLFKYDASEQQMMQQQRPWAKDPHHFKQ